MADLNYTFLLSLSIILLGFGLKKLKILNLDDGRTLAKIIFNLTLPALILTTISTIELDLSLLIMPIICMGSAVIILTICSIFLKKSPREEKGLILMTITAFNVGNFAYPLIYGVWGTEGLQYIAMFDVGNGLTVFIINYIIAAIYSPKLAREMDVDEAEPTDAQAPKISAKPILKKIATSAPLLCYFIAMGLNFGNITIPLFLGDFLGIIADANMAIVLLTLGVFLNFNFESSQWKQIGKILGIRYGFGLILGILLYFTLPFGDLARSIAMIALILPLPMALIPYAVEFEHDETLIGTIANITIIISFFLMWGMIALVI